jgi:hypothetical protein
MLPPSKVGDNMSRMKEFLIELDSLLASHEMELNVTVIPGLSIESDLEVELYDKKTGDNYLATSSFSSVRLNDLVKKLLEGNE